MRNLIIFFLLLQGCNHKIDLKSPIASTQFIPKDRNSEKPIHEFAYSGDYKNNLYGPFWQNTKALYELRITGIYDVKNCATFTSLQYLEYDSLEILIISKGNIFWPSMTKPMDSIMISKYTTHRKLDIIRELKNSLNFDYKIYQDCINKYAEPADGFGYLEIEEIKTNFYKSLIFPDGSLDSFDGPVFVRIYTQIKQVEKEFNLHLNMPEKFFSTELKQDN